MRVEAKLRRDYLKVMDVKLTVGIWGKFYSICIIYMYKNLPV